MDTLVSASLDLAAKHEAHLIGLYVIPAVRVYPTSNGFLPPAVIDSFRVFFEERSQMAKDAFDEAARKAGVEAEWRKIDSPSPKIADEVIQHGMQTDLIIASQRIEGADDGVEDGFIERVVMETGRPVLLLPQNGTFGCIGNTIIVGWNASSESARATFDAMPFLEASKATHVVWVDPEDSCDAGNLPGAELAVSLARHGVDCTVDSMSSNDDGVGGALMERASEVGADLIVMGAYGRSRMLEYVFGGASRTMLNRMSVPTLMSR